MKAQRLCLVLAVFMFAFLLCAACARAPEELPSPDGLPAAQSGAQVPSSLEVTCEAAPSQAPESAGKSNYEQISEAAAHGELEPWQSAIQAERTQYFDAKYAYRFDAEGRLTSRVLLDVSHQAAERTLTEEEAVALAASEIALYVKDFDASKAVPAVEKSDESATPWTIEFAARDSAGFLCESYRAAIDVYGEVCRLSLSRERAADAEAVLSEEEALEQAKMAVTVYIANALEEAGAVNCGDVRVDRRELQTEAGRALYSFTLSGFTIGAAEYEHSFFVGVDAISGEIRYVDRCR